MGQYKRSRHGMAEDGWLDRQFSLKPPGQERIRGLQASLRRLHMLAGLPEPLELPYKSADAVMYSTPSERIAQTPAEGEALGGLAMRADMPQPPLGEMTA